MCNFTSRSSVRPRQSMGRVARHVENVQDYLAFKRSTTPIHGKGCAWRRHVGQNVQLYLAFKRRAFDHANPWEGLRAMLKMCNFTSRSSVRPRQSMGRVARHADMLDKMCNFTSRSCVRLRQSMGRVARGADELPFYDAFARSTTPIHGKGCIPDGGVGARSGFRKNI